MVQPQAWESMEADFSVDQSGCKGGRTSIVGSRVEGSEQSMVGVSIGYVDAGGGLAFGMGIHTLNSSIPMLCEVNPIKTLSKRRMLEGKPISTFLIGSNHTTKIILVF